MNRQLNLLPNGNDVQVIDPVAVPDEGTSIENWIGKVHPNGKLEVNKHYPLYSTDLSRLLNYLMNVREVKNTAYKAAGAALGNTHIWANALFNQAIGMELVVPKKMSISLLGQQIHKNDSFFDDYGTIWLLHYLIAGNPRYVVWNFFFNQILHENSKTDLSDATSEFKIFSGRWSEYSIKKKSRAELRGILGTYTEGLFSIIKLLVGEKDEAIMVNRNSMPIPAGVFLACILAFRDRFKPGASSIGISDLANSSHSPGRIMFQNEIKARILLDELHDQRKLTIEARADLDQVRFRNEITWFDAAKDYLKRL